MPAATATVTVDDQGVVKGVRTMHSEFRELGEAADEAGEGLEEFEETSSSAASRAEDLNQQLEEGFGLTRQFADAQDQLAQGGQDVVQSFDRQTDAIERMETETRDLSTQSSKFNQIVFSSGDLVSDLQFGIKGASNNIAFMAEQMAEVSNEAGGMKNVLRGVFSALKGPAGIILGIQTLLALGPQIADWFNSREQEAADLKEQLKEAASSMLAFRDEVAGFEVETLKQAKQVRDQIQRRVRLNRDLVDLKDEVSASGVNPEDMAEMLQIVQERTSEELEFSELRERAAQFDAERLEKIEAQLPAQKQALKQAENMVQSRRAMLRLEEVLNDTIAEREESGGDGEEGEEFDFPEAEDLEDIPELEAAFDPGVSAEKLNRVVENVQLLNAELDKSPDFVDNLENAFDSLNKQRIIANALTQQFTELGKAIGQGERVMESFGKAALGTLGSIGKTMGKQLIAQGSAMLASALIPGMQGNAAAGAALVAAGTSLIAASSGLMGALQGGGGSGGPNSGPGEQNSLQGGGQASTNVEAPGRQFGGPVQGGRLYETHGLGRREFFVPGRNGQVMTRNQMRTATTRNQTVNVNGSMDANIGVENVEVDTRLERLRLELNDLDDEINALT